MIEIEYYFSKNAQFALDCDDLERALVIRSVPFDPDAAKPFPKKTGATVIDPSKLGLERISYHGGALLPPEKMPALGTYAVSYEHPWTCEKDVIFHSNTLFIAVVKSERMSTLNELLSRNPALAFSSSQFKWPCRITDSLSRRYLRWEPLERLRKLIRLEGLPIDEVLFLLGSPDDAYYNSNNPNGCWFWELGPVSSFSVDFSKELKVSDVGTATEDK
jgi:hypothetical protein